MLFADNLKSCKKKKYLEGKEFWSEYFMFKKMLAMRLCCLYFISCILGQHFSLKVVKHFNVITRTWKTKFVKREYTSSMPTNHVSSWFKIQLGCWGTICVYECACPRGNVQTPKFVTYLCIFWFISFFKRIDFSLTPSILAQIFFLFYLRQRWGQGKRRPNTSRCACCLPVALMWGKWSTFDAVFGS